MPPYDEIPQDLLLLRPDLLSLCHEEKGDVVHDRIRALSVDLLEGCPFLEGE